MYVATKPAHKPFGALLVTAVAWLALSTTANAQETSPGPDAEPVVTWGGEVEVTSRYVWRGFAYSDGAVIWPTLWIGARGFTASLFLNYDAASNPPWNEYDLAVDFERSIGRLTLSAGYTRYVYYEGNLDDGTSEVMAGAEVALGQWAIFSTHAWDIQTYRGSYYLETGVAFEHVLDDESVIAADAGIAWWSKFIDQYTRDMETHITDGRVGPIFLNVSYERRLRGALAIRPRLSLMRIGDSTGRRLLDPPGITAGLALVVGR
jgi:hypothetical protein